MNTYEQAKRSLGTADSLDQIRMSPAEHRLALASLRQGELLAEMLMRANAVLRQVIGRMGRGIGVLARRSKLPAVRSDPN